MQQDRRVCGQSLQPCVSILQPNPSRLAVQQHTRVCGQVSKGLLVCAVEAAGSEPSLAVDYSSSACLGRMDVRTLMLSPWWAAKEHGTLSL